MATNNTAWRAGLRVVCTVLECCAFVFGVASTLRAAEAPRPNVLFIAIDDLNDWVGCLGGHPDADTPNIDALAQRGVLFANAHCQAPICGPSRASVFSGLLPSTTGVYLQIRDRDLRGSSPPMQHCTFLPDYFEQHGYRTYGVGKLFHEGSGDGVFDEFGGWPDSYGPKPPKRISYSPQWYGRPGNTSTDWGAYPDSDEKMVDYKSAQWAMGVLEREHAEPFFLAVGFVRPHVPWFLPPRWFEKHDPQRVHTPPYRADDMDDVPAMAQRVAEAPMMPTTEGLISRGQWKEVVHAYLSCCTWTDHWVGELIHRLEHSPHADNTVIVLWSDHGYHLGEKNRFAKQALWERSTRVPLIIAGPTISGDRRCSRPVGLIDLYPTLLDLCGLPANEENEGRSLAPLLDDSDAAWDRPALTAYGPVNYSVRSDTHRYIVYEGGAEELYDLENDPNEWRNLAADESSAALVEAFRAQVPKNPAPMAAGSRYNFNDYFNERTERWHRGEW